ncbi:hypothetical protein HGM15179_001714, partial [Zosterops borbonicus]
TPLTSELISKSSPLEATEAKISILEELRMQGIIKSQSTTARTVEAYKNKVRGTKQNATTHHIIFFPPETAHQTTRKQTEKDCPGFESQG